MSYFVFAWEAYEPRGGYGDLWARCESLVEAMKAAKRARDTDAHGGHDVVQIVDFRTGALTAEWERDRPRSGGVWTLRVSNGKELAR